MITKILIVVSFLLVVSLGSNYMQYVGNDKLKTNINTKSKLINSLRAEAIYYGRTLQVENSVNALTEPELTSEFERVFRDKSSANTAQDCGELYTDCDNERITPFKRGEKKPSERQSLEEVLPRVEWCKEQALDFYQYEQWLLCEGDFK